MQDIVAAGCDRATDGNMRKKAEVFYFMRKLEQVDLQAFRKISLVNKKRQSKILDIQNCIMHVQLCFLILFVPVVIVAQ